MDGLDYLGSAASIVNPVISPSIHKETNSRIAGYHEILRPVKSEFQEFGATEKYESLPQKPIHPHPLLHAIHEMIRPTAFGAEAVAAGSGDAEFANETNIIATGEVPAMSTREIEQRLIAVEREIANLKAQRRAMAEAHPIQSLEKIHGIFENDKAFQEATRLGRKWRQSQRANGRKTKAGR